MWHPRQKRCIDPGGVCARDPARSASTLCADCPTLRRPAMKTHHFSAAAVALAAALGFSAAAYAAPVDLNQCQTCHSNVAKEHAGAAHKDVACTTCHAGLDKHLENTAANRPVTSMDPATCGACHQPQYTSLYKDDGRPARQSKKAADGPAPDPFFDRALGGHGFTKEHDLPRAHVWMAIDQFLVDRAFGGRFEPKDGWLYTTLEGGKSYKVWDVLKDTHPESNEHKPFKPGTAAAGNGVCWSCKSTDLMLDWAYMGDKAEGAKWSRASNAVDSVRAVSHALNCNFCHDPHNTKPRIVRDALIDAVTRTEGPSVWNEVAAHKTKVDVKDAGVRGFTRKVGYLEKPDANLMCAQCHVEYICNPGVDAKTGKPIGMDNRLTNHFPFVNADQIEAYYDKIGYRDFKHSMTGALLVKMQHPDAETFFGSKHDKAGATCASCHMPKVKDEKTGKVYTNHWATSPREYIEETCLTCHKDKTAKQMNAAIDAMHGYYDGKVRETEARMNDMFDAFEAAIAAGVDQKTLDEARKLHASAHINWEYWTAVNGAWFHNPDEAVRSLAKGAKAAQDATALLKKATAEKLAAK